MRDHYEWDRTTLNFYRYIADGVQGISRSRLVIYIPRNGGPEVPPFREGEFIVSQMTDEALELKPFGEPVRERILRPVPARPFKVRAQCCPRDNDYDGNCDIHSSPGILRTDRFATLSEHRELQRQLNSKVDVGFFNRRMGELHESMAGVKVKIQTLFNAVYWVLRHLGAVK